MEDAETEGLAITHYTWSGADEQTRHGQQGDNSVACAALGRNRAGSTLTADIFGERSIHDLGSQCWRDHRGKELARSDRLG